MKALNVDSIKLGVCYYPEHWSEDLWEDDLKRMQELGIDVVRVFEFAWTIVEPEEGKFDFALFDRFMDVAQKMNMKVIFCTPTATPPAWLTHKYPETLNRDRDGNYTHHGHRRQYNYNSKVYRDLSARITEQVAKRYGQHPCVIGWQLDNELNCEVNVFYSQADRNAFRGYMKDHFKTLDNLNDAMGTVFWNQTYTGWEQVDLQKHLLTAEGNPHMSLFEKRFFSHSAISYAKLQADIIRKYSPDRFVTTNGIFGHLDNEEFTDNVLDFMLYDSYPNFAYGEEGVNGGQGGKLKDRYWSLNLSTVRALSPNFGIMEQQGGANGWDFTMTSSAPRPGQMRMWMMQSVAHGADFVSIFRWRTAPFGPEIYWHGLNDYSNLPNRRLEEFDVTAKELKAMNGLAGSRYQANVALAEDYLNVWDSERDRWHGRVGRASKDGINIAAQLTHTPMDVFHLRFTNTYSTTADELKKYGMVFYPDCTILTPEMAKVLGEYVENGGTLVFGARTGYKDEFGRCPMRAMPGLAADICGVTVEDYTFARPEEGTTIEMDGVKHPAPVFHDILSPMEGTKVIARFSGSYYDGKPAVTVKEYPSGGRAIYVGSGMDESLVRALLEKFGFARPWENLVSCTEEMEIAVRAKGDEKFVFIINYDTKPQVAKVNSSAVCAVTGEEVFGEVELEPYGVKVLKF